MNGKKKKRMKIEEEEKRVKKSGVINLNGTCLVIELKLLFFPSNSSPLCFTL